MKQLLLSFMTAVFAAVVSVHSSYAGWNYRATMTVAGYAGSETLSGFPVLVRISPARISGFRYADCKADGSDIRFTSLDGVTYHHEIDEWNPDGESLVWVKVPSLPQGGASFLIKYGNAAAAAPTDASSVWSGNAGGNYAGVWHLNEAVDETTAITTAPGDSAKRSSSLNLDLEVYGPTNNNDSTSTKWGTEPLGTSTNVAALVGRGRRTPFFKTAERGTFGGKFLVPNYDDLSVGDTFAVSGWFRIGDFGNGGQSFFSRKSWWGDAHGWRAAPSNAQCNYVCVPGAGADLSADKYAPIPNPKNEWVHFAFIYDGSTISTYTNGALSRANSDMTPASDNGHRIGIGGYGCKPTASDYNAMETWVDELRLMDAVPSADWIKAAYDAMTVSSFVTGGTVVMNESDTLAIASTEEMEGLSPAVGFYNNLTDGQVINCVAPDTVDPLSETSRRRFYGWSLYQCNASAGTWTLVDSAKTNQYRYVHAAGTAYKLVWNARREYRHNVTVSPASWGQVVAGDNDSVAADGYLWATEDDVVTAVPNAAYSFLKWTGTGPWTSATSPSFTLNTTDPLTFIANFYKSDLDGWTYKVKMSVGPTFGDDTLEGFPVLVRISESRIEGFDYDLCQANGEDLKFSSADGSVIYPHEIDEWDTNGVSLVWVKLPALPPEGATFYMLFGNAAAPEQANAPAVWSGNAGGNYAGVWHFNEVATAENAKTVLARDSAKRPAALGLDLSMDAVPMRDYSDTTSDTLNEMVSTNGIIGRARVNEQTVSGNSGPYNQRLKVPNYDALEVGGTFAASGWFHSEITPHSESLISRRDNADSDPGFSISAWNNSEYGISIGGGTNRVTHGIYGLPSIVKNWLHIVCVFSGSVYRCYVNGCLKLEATDQFGVEDSGQGMGFGGRNNGGYGPLVGQYDEIRLLDAVPSSNWVATAYATMTDAAFVTDGVAIFNETNVLAIAATETMYGLTPEVGVYHNLTDGQVVDCIAPDAWQLLSPTSRRRYYGWSLYRSDSASGTWVLVDSATTNQCRYVHQSGTSYKLIWNSRREYRHNVTVGPRPWGRVVAGNEESVAADGYLWATENDTVTAIPNEGRGFLNWTGTGPWTDAENPSFTLNTTEPQTFTANFYRDDLLSWKMRSKMTVRPTGGTETLVGFPLLVRISPERIRNFRYEDCQEGGKDLHFTSENGLVIYPHEVDEWNTDGESLVWVKLPTLPPEGCKLVMYYKNPDVPTQERPKQVWSGNAGGNYAAVWHMNEVITADIAETTNSKDSAKRAEALDLDLCMDAVPRRGDYSWSPEDMVSTNGIVGRARVNLSLANKSMNYTQRLSVPSYDALGLGGNFAASGWFHSDCTPISYELLNRRDNDKNDPGFFVRTWNNSDDHLWFGGGLNCSQRDVSPVPSIVKNWLHIVCVYEGTTYRCYVNGVLRTEVTGEPGIQDTGKMLGIGGRGLGGYGPLVGQYDEVRLLHSVPSAEWVKASYDTMTDETFLQQGSAKPNGRGVVILLR